MEPDVESDQRLLEKGRLKIGAGLAVAAQAMVLSFIVNLPELDGWNYFFAYAVLLMAALGTLFFLGGDLVRLALDALHDRKISVDVVFFVMIAGALVGSLVGTFTHSGMVYYEVIAVIVVVHTAGKMLGARSRMAVYRAFEATREKFDECDVVMPDGLVVRQPVQDLPPGTRVRVVPGGAVTVDGEIVSGRGYLQETSMTGEWRPVSRGPGERVLAGTFSVDGFFEIRSQGGPRRLDAILAEAAGLRMMPSLLLRQADGAMKWFLAFVLVASGLTFGWWFNHASWERALFCSMAVMLVACPSALGLATPVAVWRGLARLSRMGLMARTSGFLDALAGVDVVCFDKTGTLSTDTALVRGWQVDPAFANRVEWLRAAVAAAEEGIPHPIAMALVRECAETTAVRPAVLARSVVPGQGVVARLQMPDEPPTEVRVGEWALGTSGREIVDDPEAKAGKAVYVFVGGVHAATIVLEEKWREGLPETVSELRSLGVEAEVLSGDPQAALAIGDLMPVRAGLEPAQKQTRVTELTVAGRCVAYVGDGVNDVAAMGVSHASIAIRGGAELARASSMAVFAGEDMRFLPEAVPLAQGVKRMARANFIFSAAYNITGISLAAMGLLHPVVAVLLMAGASMLVLWHAHRAQW